VRNFLLGHREVQINLSDGGAGNDQELVAGLYRKPPFAEMDRVQRRARLGPAGKECVHDDIVWNTINRHPEIEPGV